MSANAKNPSRDTGAQELPTALLPATDERSAHVHGEILATLIGIRSRARAIAALIEDIRLGRVTLTTSRHAAVAASMLQGAASQLGLGTRPGTPDPRTRHYNEGEE